MLIGLATLRIALKNSKKANLQKRIYFVVLGVAALFIWAGFIIGPVLAIIASTMPTRKKENG
jgi:hypothetical protein